MAPCTILYLSVTPCFRYNRKSARPRASSASVHVRRQRAGHNLYRTAELFFISYRLLIAHSTRTTAARCGPLHVHTDPTRSPDPPESPDYTRGDARVDAAKIAGKVGKVGKVAHADRVVRRGGTSPTWNSLQRQPTDSRPPREALSRPRSRRPRHRRRARLAARAAAAWSSRSGTPFLAARATSEARGQSSRGPSRSHVSSNRMASSTRYGRARR